MRLRRPAPYKLTRKDKRQVRSASYDSAWVLCSTVGPKALARDFGLRFDSPEQLARDYGALKGRTDAGTVRSIRAGALHGFRDFAKAGSRT